MNTLDLVFYVCKCGNGRYLKGKPRQHCKKCRYNVGGSNRKLNINIISNDNEHIITTKHKLYSLRRSIIIRCKSKKDERWYKNINVCEDWKDNPKSFYQWALDAGWKEGLTIDRIDPKGDYYPENCRFITLKQNVRRATGRITEEIARKIKSLLKAKKMCEIARLLNINYGIVKHIKLGHTWKDI